ncbi:MAG: MaoC family dehydratase [Tabrizicola sp.]|nr:MaoC family dehydratase [Tabrizicola sp.]
MTGRRLAAGMHRYGDLAVGDRIETGRAMIDDGMIDRFADLSGDRFALHMDEAAARRLGFPTRVAHGLLVLSVIDGLKNQAPAQLAAIASLNWSWSFHAPVLLGDSIRSVLVVEGKRLSRRADRGIVSFEVSALNQYDEVVQSGRNQLMMQV